MLQWWSPYYLDESQSTCFVTFLSISKFHEDSDSKHLLVLSTGWIMWIGHRKEVRKVTFRPLALRRSEWKNLFLKPEVKITNKVTDKVKINLVLKLNINFDFAYYSLNQIYRYPPLKMKIIERQVWCVRVVCVRACMLWRRQRGRVVRAPDWKSVGRGFKSRSDRYLMLSSVAPGSISRLRQ